MAIFDRAADTYDRDFTNSQTGILQRKRVYFFLEKFLSSPRCILEINCGTGEDAIWMAMQGHQVTATDVSGKMIEFSKDKQNRLAVKPDLTFMHLGFDQLRQGLNPDKKYDLIFSDFGGLNCIDPLNLIKLTDDLYNMLKPGGFFISVIMGRKCFWEKVYFLLKGQFKKMNRRSARVGVEVKVGDGIQKTFYYSPFEIRKLAENKFSVSTIKPIGIALPPSYLEPYFKDKAGLLEWLDSVEKNLAYRYFADYADHYFIALKRKTREMNGSEINRP